MFGKLHTTRKTPLNAMLLQAGITTTFILIGGGFRRLINFAVVASWAFYFLTVMSSGSRYIYVTDEHVGSGAFEAAYPRTLAREASPLFCGRQCADFV